ncbi:MAG: hypothetical protein ACREH3_11870 [Geminicoccales bacterium]
MGERKDELTKSERIFVRIALLQTVLAVAGIVTGSIALYAGLAAADAARKQQEASVWPVLQMAISDYDVETRQPIVRISARNAGIGPARIAAFRVTVDGVAQTNWNEAFTALAGSHDNVLRTYFSGRVISAGEEVDLAIARGDVARAALTKIAGSESSLEWDVCYCSVFDMCWTSSSAGQSWLQATTPVETCPYFGEEQFRTSSASPARLTRG